MRARFAQKDTFNPISEYLTGLPNRFHFVEVAKCAAITN
jgi:hypothetical protein